MSEHERILVCVSASPTNEEVILRAAALSEAMGAELIAVYVENMEMRAKDQSQLLLEHLNLAERRGAAIRTLYGNDPATAIAEYARVSQITKIVLGRSPGPFVRDTLMSRLNAMAPGIEIVIIPNQLKESVHLPWFSRFLKNERFSFGDLGRAALILTGCTVLGFWFDAVGLAITNVVLIYILGVLAVALATSGYVYSLLSSLFSVLVFNFFFTEPYYSLHSSPDYLATFAGMFTAALLSSSLTSRIKAQSIQTANKAYQTEVLLSTSQLLQKAENKTMILQVAVKQLGRLWEHSVLCYDCGEGQMDGAPTLLANERDSGFADVDIEGERHVAEWVFQNARHAGRTTRMFPEAQCLYMAVRSESRVWAVIGICATGEPAIDAYRKNLMISILDECAMAVEKDHMTREKQRMEENASQEALRANLLRSISHDLRTPLTSISGNAAILMENPDSLDRDRRKSLYTSIYDDAIWLNGLVENLLTITRTENGSMKLNLQTEVVADAVEEALRHLDRRAALRQIRFVSEEDLLLARMDARLIVQVLINLINNAIQYTREGTTILIGAEPEEGFARIWVEDDGPGIPDEMQGKVFDMFYSGVKRSPDSRRGIGLGLALCRSIVQAHGGVIGVEAVVPHGARFWFTLPSA